MMSLRSLFPLEVPHHPTGENFNSLVGLWLRLMSPSSTQQTPAPTVDANHLASLPFSQETDRALFVQQIKNDEPAIFFFNKYRYQHLDKPPKATETHTVSSLRLERNLRHNFKLRSSFITSLQ